MENGLRDLSPGGMTIKVQNDGYFRREERWRGAGVAVPVFSLRTDESLGCGEFLDIIKWVGHGPSAPALSHVHACWLSDLMLDAVAG